ncbi:3-phosphoshikimate 1-carboxyvinyltransferase [Natronospira proteinivora]|uniref:3-phosphoshikimate 1-carboxyvinyltransferase n=1 Tax=Natronospira proteinivora TaxID=1807133 RepID=A0ABT1G6J8_9GAMM|nr:3-phosphoshikimate 1-carboxyvinyltransferase [Natronospira proteinivora]MCP1726929.1 3-phosphoshikimate 1-carboxyvinyltransferase [Natronospira proteinivora]
MGTLDWRIRPSPPLSGQCQVPGDKSISHRALLFLALSQQGGRVTGLLESEDCLRTLAALRRLGASIDQLGPGDYQLAGWPDQGLVSPDEPLDMGNSGTGMRLLTGVLAGAGISATLSGDASLCRRPMGRVVNPLRMMGAAISADEGKPPLNIGAHPGLHGIDYVLPVASAQVKSALMLAGLFAEGETRLTEPGPSRDHSERMLNGLGAQVDVVSGRLVVQPGRPRGGDVAVPGDLSSAAFALAAAAARPGAQLRVEAVGVNPTRYGILRLLERMGARLQIENRREIGGEPVADINVEGAVLKAIRVGAEDVVLAVDEIPALLIAAAQAEGRTEIHGATELRVKESDRLAAMAEGLERLGLAVTTREDGLSVVGGRIQPAVVRSWGDHRIAMSLAMLAASAEAGEGVVIEDVANVATSFPEFPAHCRALGMNLEQSG